MMIPQIVRFAVEGAIIFLIMQLSEILHSYWSITALSARLFLPLFMALIQTAQPELKSPFILVLYEFNCCNVASQLPK